MLLTLLGAIIPRSRETRRMQFGRREGQYMNELLSCLLLPNHVGSYPVKFYKLCLNTVHCERRKNFSTSFC